LLWRLQCVELMQGGKKVRYVDAIRTKLTLNRAERLPTLIPRGPRRRTPVRDDELHCAELTEMVRRVQPRCARSMSKEATRPQCSNRLYMKSQRRVSR
jgi:hypothetical protein